MKPTISIFLFILIAISSCTTKADKNFKKFTLQGEINGQDTGIIVLAYYPNETIIYDTTKIENGKFVFTGNIFGPIAATLNGRNGSNIIRVFLDPQEMKISLPKDNFNEYKMTGSKTQNDFDLLNKMKKPFYKRIKILRDQYNNINDSIKNSKNSSAKEILEKKAEEIDRQWSEIRKEIDSIGINFVLRNPKSLIAIDNLLGLEANEVISLDSAKSIFNGLDNSLKQTQYGKYITEDFRKKDNIRIGNQAPDFKATDLNQQTVTLSQFKGRSVVLLDFWASWCVPCRESIPHLKTLYKKYHSKGFEVIAVWYDNFGDRKGWIEAVKHDSTDMWYQIPVAEKYPCRPSQLTNDDVYKNYFVSTIPVQMLIDKNGKIIYRHVGYSKESEESLDKQLSALFDK